MSSDETTASVETASPAGKHAEPTIGRLVADASRDISSLVQYEIALAKSELRVSLKAGGIGAALLAVTAFFGVLVLIFLSIAVAYFITMAGLHAAWAFLIVTGFYLLLALILLLIGIRKLKQVSAPEKTISTAKELPTALKPKSSPKSSPESSPKSGPESSPAQAPVKAS